jgi:hypothetical protein
MTYRYFNCSQRAASLMMNNLLSLKMLDRSGCIVSHFIATNRWRRISSASSNPAASACRTASASRSCRRARSTLDAAARAVLLLRRGLHQAGRAARRFIIEKFG